MTYRTRLAGYALLTLVVLSCREQTTPVEEAKPERFLNPYSAIGQAHNAGLDNSFSYIKANKNRLNSRQELSTVAKEAILNSLPEKKDFSIHNLVGQIEIILAGRHHHLSKSGQATSSSDSLFLSLGYHEKQIVFLNRLFDLTDSSLSIGVAKDSISNINRDAFSILGPETSRPILVISSVLESSFEYWSTHLQEWKMFFGSLNGATLHKRTAGWEPDWLAIGAADAAGAAAAAIPCIAATIGYPECVGGAALGASAWEATLQLWDYWFPE